MFSDRERRHMRTNPVRVPVQEREVGEWSDSNSSSTTSSPESNGQSKSSRDHEAKMISMKLRRFYAYWGLKEAYIKMVGEGLLASWLRELEFLGVHAPPPPASREQDARSSTASSYGARNSSVTHNKIGSHGKTLPASADANAHRKPFAPMPPSLPALGKTPQKGTLSTSKMNGGGAFEERKSVAGVTPLDTITSHRRKASIPSADMYAQRKASISSPDATKPRALFSPTNNLTNNFILARPQELMHLSHFPESPSNHHPEPQETAKFTPPDQAEHGMTTLLHGKRVRDVQIELVAYDEDFMIATAIRGVKEREVQGEAGIMGEGNGWWLRLDFENDIRPCAEGRCSCLDQ